LAQDLTINDYTMKTLKMTILTVIVAAIALFLFYAFKSRQIDTPDYTIIKRINNVEIRRYPRMIVAQTSLADKSFSNSGSAGFRVIANYIFGGNADGQKIAMTAPVVMNMGDSANMYFVMPKQYRKDELPAPASSDVKIMEVAEKTLAVITFGGFANDKKINAHCQELEKVLKDQSVIMKGSFMFMGYNAPWDVVNRRNEVAIEVDWLQN
jgi:hypothetical protein